MYPFTKKVSTDKYSKWIMNECKYIILHHTWSHWFEDNVRYLSAGNSQVSVHFVIWEDEECAKIWIPSMVMRHAWQSQRWNLTNMNKYSLWIEVVWFWEYNQHQFIRLTDLVEYLMAVYKIPKENILLHSSITQVVPYSKNKILWDWKRSSRKVDLWLKFFPMWFEKRRDLLKPRAESRYGNI